MASSIVIMLNGTERAFGDLGDPPHISDVVEALGFRADRVALEHNGEIVSRTAWAETAVGSGDRIELVHFVGGGCG